MAGSGTQHRYCKRNRKKNRSLHFQNSSSTVVNNRIGSKNSGKSGSIDVKGISKKENKRAEKGMDYSSGGASNGSGSGNSDVKEKGTIGLQTGNNGVVQYPSGPNK